MEYFLKFWGAEETDIVKKYDIKDTNFWFNTWEEREAVKRKILGISKNLGISEEEGSHLTHRETIACITLGYKKKKYYFEESFGFEYPLDSVYYMFEHGNFSCDCNKSQFIQQYCDKKFPELDCGNLIDLVDIKIKLGDIRGDVSQLSDNIFTKLGITEKDIEEIRKEAEFQE
jgi:hypothetical protein